MSDYIELSVLIANLNKNKNCPITNKQREDEIEHFFENLNSEPDLVLLQDAYVEVNSRIDQIRTLQNALSDNWKFCYQTECKTKIFEKNNVILSDSSQIQYETSDFCFSQDIDKSKFCIAKYVIRRGVSFRERETLLVVSFHGTRKMDVVQKVKHLKTFLKEFKKLKQESKSSHLIIGGDFNVDLDVFGRKESEFLQYLGLKIVPYKNQGANKCVGIICDKEIAKLGATATVFTDLSNTFEDENTEVVESGMSPDTLVHQPILFNLKFPIR
jgi:hypothetical protein